MKRSMVRYKVRPERAAENERYIARVFEQLEREKPAGLWYASFKLADGVSFVHIVSHETADGRNPLSELSAFKTFAAGVRERCEEPPIAVELNEMGPMVSSVNDRRPDAILSELQDARQRFLALVDEVRPELHRYCARMTGSIADGEDVVQDALARAYYELSELKELPPLRPWLFRIAHNRAIDYLRRYERRMSEPLDVAMDFAADAALEPDNALARQDAVRTAVSRFLELPPAQRSCVILKDVLEHSLEEIAAMLELSVPAIKAALHRGRARLRELSAASEQTSIRASSPALLRYAELFNGRDWDGVRAMLVDDVKLDLVTRWKAAGRRQVGTIYLTNYDGTSDWHLVPGWLDSREVLAVFRDPGDARPGYFIELTVVDGRIAAIHDFRYVPYIGREAAIELSRSPPVGWR